MTMKIKPCGFQVLIEMEDVEEKSEGGIIMQTMNEQEREQRGHDVGRIVAFGPVAYQGFSGCDGPEDWHPDLKEGALVEFRRYDGKIPRHDLDMKYRVVNDSDILMVIER